MNSAWVDTQPTLPSGRNTRLRAAALHLACDTQASAYIPARSGVSPCRDTLRGKKPVRRCGRYGAVVSRHSMRKGWGGVACEGGGAHR